MTIYNKKRLKSCLIHAPSYSELSAIFLLRSIYKPDDYTLTAEQEFILNRRFATGIEKFRDNKEIKKILERVARYNDRLKSLGIKDEEVPNFKKRYLRDILSIGKSLGLLCFNAAFVFIFKILFFLFSKGLAWLYFHRSLGIHLSAIWRI